MQITHSETSLFVSHCNMKYAYRRKKKDIAMSAVYNFMQPKRESKHDMKKYNKNKSPVMQLRLSFSEIVIPLTKIASQVANKVASLAGSQNKAASEPLREVGH